LNFPSGKSNFCGINLGLGSYSVANLDHFSVRLKSLDAQWQPYLLNSAL